VAYYKIEFAGEEITVPHDLNNIKAATAQLICIPFNTPYIFMVPTPDEATSVVYDRNTAPGVASKWGFTFYRSAKPLGGEILKNQYIPGGSNYLKNVKSSANENNPFGAFSSPILNSIDELREAFSFFVDKRRGDEVSHSYTTIKEGNISDWDNIISTSPHPGPAPTNAAVFKASDYTGIFPTEWLGPMNWSPPAGFPGNMPYSLKASANNASIMNEWIVFENTLLLNIASVNGAANSFPAYTGKSFIDATFMLPKPFVEAAYKEALGEKMGISDPVRIKANYNFYLQRYENITKNLKSEDPATQPMPERVLPNLYAIMIDSAGSNDPDYRFKYADQWQYHNSDLLGYLKAIFSRSHAAKLGPSMAWPQAPWGKVTTFNEYLNNFAKTLDATVSAAGAGQLGTSLLMSHHGLKYGIVALSAYKMKDFMEESDNIKKFFPMHVDIEVPSSTHGPIGKALYESNMFDQFMGTLIGALYPRTENPDGNTEVQISTAIVKKDSYITDKKIGDNTLVALEDNLYHEDLRKLWLNDVLQTPSLPDLKNVGTVPVYSYGPPEYNFYKSPAPLDDNTQIYTDVSELWDALTSTQITDSEAIGILNDQLNLKIGDSAITRPIIFGQKESPPVKFINNIKWEITRNKINEFIKEKARSVKEIYEGHLAHSEVLFYEVVKFRSEPPEAGGKYLQSIFLPNTPGMEALKYIDTQVKFDTEYYYQIYAHTLVVGTQYQYTGLTWASGWGASGAETVPSGHVQYKSTPSVYLIRAPYYNTYVTMRDAASIPDFVPELLKAQAEGEDGESILVHENQKPGNLERTPVYDKPPVFPDVNFLPLYAEKNKILLNTNFNVGEYDLEPIFIDTVDQATIDLLDKIRRNQKRVGKNDKITFRSDDFCGKIQILRTDKKPLSWDSFSPTANYIIGETGGSAAFGFFDDTLQPNKDYYYTVRAKDVHGNFSNPSPIYHVRIVAKEGEAPYTIIKMFFLEEVEDKKPTVRKNLMKYIRIQPSFKQTFLDEKSVTTNTSWGGVKNFVAAGDAEIQKVIGDETLDKTVFGRRFKLRFTSKKTGRKFDLNLTIDNPYVASAEGLASTGAPDDYSSGKCG